MQSYRIFLVFSLFCFSRLHGDSEDPSEIVEKLKDRFGKSKKILVSDLKDGMVGIGRCVSVYEASTAKKSAFSVHRKRDLFLGETMKIVLFSPDGFKSFKLGRKGLKRKARQILAINRRYRRFFSVIQLPLDYSSPEHLPELHKNSIAFYMRYSDLDVRSNKMVSRTHYYLLRKFRKFRKSKKTTFSLVEVCSQDQGCVDPQRISRFIVPHGEPIVYCNYSKILKNIK